MHSPPDTIRTIETIALRDGTTLDIAEIVGALPAAVAEAIAAELAATDPWRRYGFPLERLLPFLAPRAGAPRYLLLREGSIAGLVALKPGWMFGTYLNLLAVLATHRRCGVGSAVLDWLERTARAHGERNQFVVTSAFNAPALILYERHGFRRIAQMPGLIADGETEILLRKTLF